MEHLRSGRITAVDGTSQVTNLAACLEALPTGARHTKRLELLELLTSARLSEAEREASGRALVAWLAEGSFDAPTRRRLVRAVLELGFPWALHLEAEDVRMGRERPPRRRVWVALLSTLLLGMGGSAREGVTPLTGRVETTSEPAGDLEARQRFTASLAAGTPRVEHHRGGGLAEPPATAEPTGQSSDVRRAQAEACLRDAPASLGCVFEAARAHARRSRDGFRAARLAPTLKARVLEEAAAAEHEAQARALYRRYLSIAPTGDLNAPVIVTALQRDGDWVEWTSGDAAARELENIQLACPPANRDCLTFVLQGWEARAARTKHPDDVRAAAGARASVEAASQGSAGLEGILRGLGQGSRRR